MITSLPPLHHQLLAKGRMKRGAEGVLAQQALHPDEHSDDRGLIYVSPELVAGIKECKYSTGWGTGRILPTKTAIGDYPHLQCPTCPCTYHQQERTAYQDQIGKASMLQPSTLTKKGESSRPRLARSQGTTIDSSKPCPATSSYSPRWSEAKARTHKR
jgi:hypothetical protein